MSSRAPSVERPPSGPPRLALCEQCADGLLLRRPELLSGGAVGPFPVLTRQVLELFRKRWRDGAATTECLDSGFESAPHEQYRIALKEAPPLLFTKLLNEDGDLIPGANHQSNPRAFRRCLVRCGHRPRAEAPPRQLGRLVLGIQAKLSNLNDELSRLGVCHRSATLSAAAPQERPLQVGFATSTDRFVGRDARMLDQLP